MSKKMKRENLRKVIIIVDGFREKHGYFGYFHEWSSNYDEFENGPGQYPVGIVEKPNGEIKIVYAENIQFETRSDAELADDGELKNWLR
jgi:hypothetical protein